MFVAWQNHKLKSLLYITAIALALLLWVNRLQTFQHWTNYYQTNNSVSETQSPVKATSPQKCGLRPKVQNGQKVRVNGTKTLLMSVYQEHRTGKREVRFIAVVLRSEKVDYVCHLCCQGQLHISDGVSYIHADHFQYDYGTADIMCPVPSGCETPSLVAVTSAAHKSEDEVEFFEVQNQIKSRYFVYNFTVCFSNMFNFTNVLQLVQSLEMLQLLGVNKVAIYKTSNSPETQRVLDYYTQKGLLEVIPWSLSKFLKVSQGFIPQRDPGDLHYYGQIPALNDCLYRYMYQSRYVAQHDTDELILPQSVNSWSELLPQLEQKYGRDRCYMFENNVFPNTVTRPPPNSRTQHPESWQNVPGVNILAHLYQEPNPKETLYSNFKIIFNPRAVTSTSVHGVLQSQNGCSWVQRNVARLYHTRHPKQPHLAPEKLIYDDRLLKYSGRLIPAVNKALTESGILPDDSLQTLFRNGTTPAS